MRTTLRKWGNSLAVRIPNAIAKELDMTSGTLMDLSIKDGTILLTPASEPEFDLEELMRDVTKANLHDALDWGDPMGREAW